MNGAVMKSIRTTRKLSQADLAEMISSATGRDYSKSSVSKWESGREPIPEPVEKFMINRFRAAIIAITNQKGGVAKTISAVSLSYAISKQGFRVLLVDADPQANATMLCGLDPVQLDKKGLNIHHLLFVADNLAIDTVIQRERGSMFDVLPSGLRLSQGEQMAAGLANREGRLKTHLDQVRDRYDIIMIDTGPNLGIMTMSALHAATSVIIPTQLAPFDLYGVDLSIGAIDEVRKWGNPGLKILGILPTKTKMTRVVDRQLLAECKDRYPSITVFAPVPASTDVDKAVYNGTIPLASLPAEHPLRVYEDIAGAIVAMTISGQKEIAR